jgi:hypothetical protein
MKLRKILSMADAESVRKGAMFSPHLVRYDNRKAIFEFETHGETGLYRQMIQIDPSNLRIRSIKESFVGVDMDEAFENLRVLSDKVDILVYCDCPAFLYRGFAYIATKMGFAVKKESRPPRIRNPRLRGSVCKHLVAVLRMI